MDNIIKFLELASKEYYKGNPIISDPQFDCLAKQHNFNNIGHKVKTKKAPHYKPMYSLQKYYEDEGTDNPLAGISDISYSPKIDGAAISLLYYDGILIQALTRGDGTVGQVITNKMYASGKVVKLSLKGKRATGYTQITGEIAASKEIPNSRNYAAGSLNLKDVEEFRTRAITFIAYDCFPYLRDTYDDEMLDLSRLGFTTVKDSDLQNIYPTDGIVYRCNKHSDCEALGYTSKHPKFSYARKERQDTVETTLLAVEWNTGRSGRVTPVAILEPVLIDGKEVSRATLNNPGFIEAADLHIGDTVAIRLAGMIIPEITHKVDA